ncbi:MAG: glycosyltransferase [Rhodospirillales bacterium]|nr:glycosyltransferase [Rhodospirillales bacterium]
MWTNLYQEIAFMKILLCSNNYPPYPGRGEAVFTELLANQLASKGIEVAVINAPQRITSLIHWENGIHVYDMPGFDPEIIERLSKVGVSAKEIEQKIIARYQALLRETADVFEEVKPDILHTSSVLAFSSQIWPVAKKMGIKVVHTLCEYHLLCKNQEMFLNDVPCTELCSPCQVPMAKHLEHVKSIYALGAVSNNVLQRHLDHGFFANIKHQKIIPYGTPVNQTQNHIRQQGEPLNIGYIGRVSPGKGVTWLLEQVSELSVDNWLLCAAGNGDAEYIDKLKALYPKPKFTFPGFTNRDLFFSQTDVLVAPPLIEEPFGLVLIEALAAGVPVIASNRGGIPEVAEKSKGKIFLYDPEKPNDFKFLIERFIRNPEYLDKLRKQCRTVAIENFSVDKMCESYLELYQTVL